MQILCSVICGINIGLNHCVVINYVAYCHGMTILLVLIILTVSPFVLPLHMLLFGCTMFNRCITPTLGPTCNMSHYVSKKVVFVSELGSESWL